AVPDVRRRSAGLGLGVCFFFQAEDGIRDFHVTGVQTCALPIYFHDVSSSNLTEFIANSHLLLRQREETAVFAISRYRHPNRKARSEERRVGKECRCRWSP